jgi:acetyl-CoA carboxylase biotin carboxyl carrier protein
LNIEELKELLEFVSERNIAELELEEGGTKLKIRKSLSGPALKEQLAAVAAAAIPETAVAPVVGAPAAAETAAEDGLTYITSPIVGTFYRQPEPGADPFAREGDFVKKGQVLCIIEAMKL